MGAYTKNKEKEFKNKIISRILTKGNLNYSLISQVYLLS